MRIPTGTSGLIETGGGRKNLNDVGKYFLAVGDLAPTLDFLPGRDTLIALNSIISGRKTTPQLATESHRLVTEAAGKGIHILLDSGGFSLAYEYAKQIGTTPTEVFMSSPSTLPFYEKWMTCYEETVSTLAPNLWGYVEFDFGSIRERRLARERNYANCGISPIPVFRLGLDPITDLDRLLETHDRICVAGWLNLKRNLSIHALLAVHERWQTVNPDCYIHALGMAALGVFSSFNLPSCDASTYANAARFGLTCGYTLAGFSHSAHFTPRFPLGSEVATGEHEKQVSGHAHQLGMMQHSFYGMGRKEYLRELKSCTRSLRYATD